MLQMELLKFVSTWLPSTLSGLLGSSSYEGVGIVRVRLLVNIVILDVSNPTQFIRHIQLLLWCGGIYGVVSMDFFNGLISFV